MDQVLPLTIRPSVFRSSYFCFCTLTLVFFLMVHEIHTQYYKPKTHRQCSNCCVGIVVLDKCLILTWKLQSLSSGIRIFIHNYFLIFYKFSCKKRIPYPEFYYQNCTRIDTKLNHKNTKLQGHFIKKSP